MSRFTFLLAMGLVALALGSIAIASEGMARKSTVTGVTVTITPMDLGSTETLKFKVVLDTHSQELSDDLIKTALLVDSAGTRYLPVAWEGAAPGGHHREGVLVFPSINAASTDIELRLQRTGEAAPRVFRWGLTN